MISEDVDRFALALDALMDAHRGRLTYIEMIGCLEVAKVYLHLEAHDDDSGSTEDIEGEGNDIPSS